MRSIISFIEPESNLPTFIILGCCTHVSDVINSLNEKGIDNSLNIVDDETAVRMRDSRSIEDANRAALMIAQL